jgi:hypothetical protein
MLRNFMKLGLSILILAASLPFAPAASAQTNIYTDLASFEAAAGPLTEIDFEELPYDAGPDNPLPNPLTLNGVTFSSPFRMQGGFCSSPTCQPDPGNPGGGNIGLFFSGGTIDFPARTGGALLVIEGIGDGLYTAQVTDFGGNTIIASGQGVPYGISYLGFTSTTGIQRINIANSRGPLFFTAIFVELNDPDVTSSAGGDPVNDVTSPQGNITYAVAQVSGEMVDLRLQFLAPPFSTANTQQITWCFDTDQNAATGNGCAFGSSGADVAFTLSGGPNALSGNNFTFSGALADLDPCTVGSFNENTNMLRLVFPAYWLSDDGIFNYAVRSVLSSAVDSAPNTVNLGTPHGFFTSTASELPFSGRPLCSFKHDTSITINPQLAGTALFYPELGGKNAAATSTIQSWYAKTTPINREFRRGLMEFRLPEIQESIVKASLSYQGDWRDVLGSSHVVTHELSYYQPADLVIDVNDADRPTTFLSFIQTDASKRQDTFSVDITDLVKQRTSNTIGFRIKLEVDPTYNEMGFLGTSFGNLLSDVPDYPRIVIQFVDAQTTVTPTMDSTLVYTDTQGNATNIFVPANTVTQTTELFYTEQAASLAPASTSVSSLMVQDSALPPMHITADLTHSIYLPLIIGVGVPARTTMIGRPFTLDGYRAGQFTSGSILQKPMTITLRYTDAEVSRVNETSLTLNYWNGNQWIDAACGPYQRYPDENKIVVSVCALDEFSLLGRR